MHSFRPVIDFWPTYELLAGDIGATPAAVKQMRHRDTMPSKYWLALVRSAERRGYPPIQFEYLAKAAAQSNPTRLGNGL